MNKVLFLIFVKSSVFILTSVVHVFGVTSKKACQELIQPGRERSELPDAGVANSINSHKIIKILITYNNGNVIISHES